MSPQQPLRIALISEHASPLVARCLARAGHHVDVFTRRDDAALPAAVDVRPGMRVLHIPAGPARFVAKEALLAHMPAFATATRQLMARSVRYDVVHANDFMSGLVALRLKESFGTPIVMTFHAPGSVRREHRPEADAFAAARIEIERRIVAHADRIVAECPQDRADLMRLYDARDSRIAIVPCGVDTAEFAPGDRVEARRKLGLAPLEFIVLQLGRLVPRKGIDNVIRAVALLPEAMNARLLVVGGETREPDEQATPEIARLRAVAEASGIAPRVSFVGHRQRHELADYYNAADMFVTTPWYEPFGITPLEAMACGTPVIGSRVGGIQHSVVDGVTGALVPPHDPEALAERLTHLHANPALSRALGRAGIRRARSLFSWQHVASELTEVYEAVRWRSHQEHAGRRLHLVGRDAAPAAQRVGAHP